MGDSAYGTPPDRSVPHLPGLPEGVSGPTDPEVVGCLGVVTIRIPGGDRPGEVRVFARGGYELHIAFAPESLPVGEQIQVDRSRGARAVDVSPVVRET